MDEQLQAALAQIKNAMNELMGNFSAFMVLSSALMLSHPDKRLLRRTIDRVATDLQLRAALALPEEQLRLSGEARQALQQLCDALDKQIAKEDPQDPA